MAPCGACGHIIGLLETVPWFLKSNRKDGGHGCLSAVSLILFVLSSNYKKKLHILIVTLTKVTMIDNVKLMDYLSPFGGYVQPF